MNHCPEIVNSHLTTLALHLCKKRSPNQIENQERRASFSSMAGFPTELIAELLVSCQSPIQP
jgi:hypothetical protein